MALSRKFTFDKPEDSYWNNSVGGESSSGTASTSASVSNSYNNPNRSFFNDDPVGANAAEAARAALDDLWDTTTQIKFGGRNNDDTSSTTSDGTDRFVEIVDWSGTPITAAVGTSATPDRNHPLKSSTMSSVDLLATASRFGIIDHQNVPSPYLSLYNNESSSTIDANCAASLISDGSIGSSAGGELNSAMIKSHSEQADYLRLKSEFKKLQIHYEQTRHERYKAPSIDETIRRLLRGDVAILDFYKTKHDKLELLASAIDYRDGNVILAVVLFLKRTLSDWLFRDVLLQNPLATNHYISHLRDLSQFDELTDSLYMIGRTDDAAMMEYSIACRKRSPDGKLQALKKTLISGFNSTTLVNESALIAQHIAMLERQMPIDASDEIVNKSGKESTFTTYPKTASLVDQPPLTTLYYCALHHYDLPITSFASPMSIRDTIKCTDKEYIWIVTTALARQKRWLEIEKLLTTKKLLGGTKIASPVPHQHLLRILNKYHAPNDILIKFIRPIVDINEKLELAERYAISEMIVDCSVALRDRQRLAMHLSTLTAHTKEYYYAQAAMNNNSFKWKN